MNYYELLLNKVVWRHDFEQSRLQKVTHTMALKVPPSPMAQYLAKMCILLKFKMSG